MSLVKRQTVDQDTKYLVYGWIHETEKLLQLKNNISNLIIELCVSFFHLSIVNERFSIYDPEYVNVSEDKKTVTQISFNNTYCSFGINQIPTINNRSKYEWDIDIKHMDTRTIISSRMIFIGISSLSHMNTKRRLSGYNYVYQIFTSMTGGCTFARSFLDRKTKTKSYGKIYETGDKVTICLDLEKKELSFKLNGDDQGVAFDDIKVGPEIKYRLIVKLWDLEQSVKIDKFRKL
eukprot:208069_1